MTAPLKIGLLTPACRGYNAIDGGIASHFADLAIALADEGHDVRVVTPAAALPPSPGPEFARVRFVPFDATLPRWLHRLAGVRWQLHAIAGLNHRITRAADALAAAHRDEPLDIVETTSTGVLAARFVRSRSRCALITRVSTTAAQLVSHNRSESRWPERVEQRREDALVRASDGLLTHTRDHRDEICRLWGIAPEKFTIIPHGIAIPDSSELSPPHAREFIDVLFVGRFEHRKGIDLLLAIIPAMLATHPRVRFTLAGMDAGDYWQRQFRAANPTVDARRVSFTGVLSAAALREAYRNCDVFVAPSRYESFGLIYVEAMAWGKPAIGGRTGGVPEVIEENITGLLAEPGDAVGLRACLTRLVDDSAARAQMGEAARRRVMREFSRQTMARRSAELYAATAARVSSRRSTNGISA